MQDMISRMTNDDRMSVVTPSHAESKLSRTTQVSRLERDLQMERHARQKLENQLNDIKQINSKILDRMNIKIKPKRK